MRPDITDLKILETLHRTRSVTATADTLGLSQPTISVRLEGLRQHFKDPLFVRSSAGMQPTPQVEMLIPMVQQALVLFEGKGLPAFDPISSERRFRIGMTSVGQVTTLPELVKRIKSIAPCVQLEVVNLTSDTHRELETGDMDVAMGTALEIRAGFYQQHLYYWHYVCVVRKNHPKVGSRLTLKRFRELEQVGSSFPRSQTIVDRALEELGVKQRVSVRVPSYLWFPQIIAQTDLMAVVPNHLAEVFAKDGELRVLPVPIKLPSHSVKHYWHTRFHRDPANMWLRRLIVDFFRPTAKAAKVSVQPKN